jgi:hypothetical protein
VTGPRHETNSPPSRPAWPFHRVFPDDEDKAGNIDEILSIVGKETETVLNRLTGKPQVLDAIVVLGTIFPKRLRGQVRLSAISKKKGQV